jgi:uncharacterized protein (TIGR02466 family)
MSEIKIHKFFPVPVFEQKLEDYKILNNELEKFIYDLKKKNPDGQKKSNAGGWHSPFFNIQETDVLKKFVRSFQNSLHKIMSDHMGWQINKEKIKILDMWSIINSKNTFNLQHNHPNSLLSAAYYVKASKNSGKIKFFDPKEMKTMYHPPIKSFNEISAEIIKLEPEEGKLLLFPSYLHHAVEENLSDDDRIVISFNLIC